MQDHYLRWADLDCVEQFANKSAPDFFRSEKVLFRQVADRVSSVFDIGCASGRMIELLRQFNGRITYSGIDIVDRNITLARETYPDAKFAVGNGLDFDPQERFDLVNATGVCQHEPQFERLVERMVALSKGHVMFDVKFADLADHLVDRNESYCKVGENRLFMVLLSLPKFMRFVLALPDVGSVEVFGYETPPNASTTVPKTIRTLVSAGVLLHRKETEEGKGNFVRIYLPRSGWSNVFA